MAILQRTVTYLIISASVIALIAFTRPTRYTGMHSILLPARVIKAASDGNTINVYPFAPLRYQRLAYINIEKFFAGNVDAVAAEAKARAKQLASSVGADAIVITYLGTVPDASGPMRSVYIFRGIAIDEH